MLGHASREQLAFKSAWRVCECIRGRGLHYGESVTDPWIPFDATDDEIENLHVVREGVPETLRPPLTAWIAERISGGYGKVNVDLVHAIQSSLRVSLGVGAFDGPSIVWVVDAMEQQGDSYLIRVVDFLVSIQRMPDGWGNEVPEVTSLKFYLDANGSAYEVHMKDQEYRLRRRVLGGIEELVQQAIDLGDVAGKHLSNAWHAAFGLEANETHAMTEAIRAVEAAARPVLSPKDKKATLGKMTGVLRDQRGWGLVLQTSDGFPNQAEVIIGMLETLAKAQQDRHAGKPPTTLEAQAHVQLAATLVFWFSSEAVVQDKGSKGNGLK